MPTLPNGIGGKKVFEVFGLGDGQYRSEEKVFSVFNLKYPTNQTATGLNGTFKNYNQ